MRMHLPLLALASLAAATSPVARDGNALAVDAERDLSILPVQDVDKRWCLLGFIGDSCFTAKTTAKTTTTAKTSSSSTAKPSSSSTAKPSSSTVQPTSSAAPSSVDSSSAPTATVSNPATTVDNSTATATATATPTAATTSAYATTTSYSYSQPPLPARTVSAPASLFTASGGDYISPFAQTRVYDFTIDYATGSPAGFKRSMMVINGQFPGPLIEANQGDTMQITVHNNLDIPQSIHWHGIRQNHSNYADGVPGIAQCPIQPGHSFTYTFTLESEMGTYWYHSHYSNTMADGIMGAFIVYSRKDPLQKFINYDSERVMYLVDMMNDQSETIVDGILDATVGYRGSPIAPDPDAILINSVGQTDCSEAQAGVPCVTNSPAVVKAVIGQRVRFRILNPSSHAMIRLSIDKHTLNIVEVDDTPVKTVSVHELLIAPAQRYSIIVNMNAGTVGNAFWIRATTASSCMNPDLVIQSKAILRYTDLLGLTWFGTGIPTTSEWADTADPSTAACEDMDQLHTFVPLQAENAPATALETSVMDSSFGQFVNRATGKAYIGFGYNGVSYTNYINNPLLSQIQKGLTLDPTVVAAVTYTAFGGVDLIINNLDPATLSHPFHLHGRPFYIVARGTGSITAADVASQKLTLTNPLRRDTIVIPGDQWVILRIMTDTPGVWPLHCHIGWHLAVGKLGVVVIRPDEVRKQAQPSAWSGLCSGLDANAIGPARRTLPPQARAHHGVRAGHHGHGSHAARVLPVEVEQRDEMFTGGVRDFSAVPEGLERKEFRQNATHWWVPETVYHGLLNPEVVAENAREKRWQLETRAFFMNETDWWVPGTIFHGKVAHPLASGEAYPTPTAAVAGPGTAIAAVDLDAAGSVIQPVASTFVQSVPATFTPGNSGSSGVYIDPTTAVVSAAARAATSA
ncbi:laccase, multicopper oxidase, benzenediol:oxygen oxidorectuctase [Apiotrichum porosum]|uniref:Laccase, multicopper oxidase, benzenediol:oxygen oxidorectuctase n=1 Tax=Apiotrichum porosum TaxID=105984 RepID=A0A427XEH0_9TREE|nr:laccase, multicopper oxidase, benzenediol:oxygen oxidorectuctase [Apiotrichum porosum]RSH77255.1 laccase, multicopper oxidase, benzenediol:oxygen oxidorectuctase [Apiotrichum porosum]